MTSPTVATSSPSPLRMDSSTKNSPNSTRSGKDSSGTMKLTSRGSKEKIDEEQPDDRRPASAEAGMREDDSLLPQHIAHSSSGAHMSASPRSALTSSGRRIVTSSSGYYHLPAAQLPPSVCGFSNPMTLRWFLSIVGSEYCHIYFWIIKDLCWMQSWRHFSIYAGICALVWCAVILFHTLRTLNYHEMWHFVTLFLWLFANFWWMIGEAHDYENPDAAPISMQHTYSSAKMLEVALIWCLIYYMIILPFNLLPLKQSALEAYDDGAFRSRFACFTSFRQYENLHMLFWIAKDLAWNRLNLTLWLSCMVPTLLIALDFIFIAAMTRSEDNAVDTVHFLAIFMWVIGNSVWAYGDFFLQDYSEPVEMWSSATTTTGFRGARWYSSWILFSSFVPIFMMYGMWGSLTILGYLKGPDAETSPEFHSNNVLEWFPFIEEDEMLADGQDLSNMLQQNRTEEKDIEMSSMTNRRISSSNSLLRLTQYDEAKPENPAKRALFSSLKHPLETHRDAGGSHSDESQSPVGVILDEEDNHARPPLPRNPSINIDHNDSAVGGMMVYSSNLTTISGRSRVRSSSTSEGNNSNKSKPSSPPGPTITSSPFSSNNNPQNSTNQSFWSSWVGLSRSKNSSDSLDKLGKHIIIPNTNNSIVNIDEQDLVELLQQNH